jgi:hypothetical protein
MNPSEAYLNAVEQIVTPLCNAYVTLDATPDELPTVKYPRGHSIGHRQRRIRTARGT